MKLHTLIVVFFLSVLSSTIVQADEDPKHLIQSCQELVGIYSKRDEKHLVAGLTTSLSEALRAGYCRGVVEEYRRHYSRCAGDWFTQAHAIANQQLSLDKPTSVQNVLRVSCGI